VCLRAHRSGRLDGSDRTIDGFVGTCTGADIEHGFGTYGRPLDRRCDARIRPAVLSVSAADAPVVGVTTHAIRKPAATANSNAEIGSGGDSALGWISLRK
jgi:hypothetical protein